MEVKNFNGNLLDSKATLICHQVNCQGKMRSGVAAGVAQKWPEVREAYEHLCSQYTGNTASMLGLNLPVTVSKNGDPLQKVMNLFAEDHYGYDGKRYTSYDALDDCLKKIATYCKNNDIHSIAFPCRMSSVRGGANWNVVFTMIQETFKDLDITVEIWDFGK